MVTTSCSSGSSRIRRVSQGCASNVLPRGVCGAFAVRLVPGHDVPRYEPVTRQTGLVAHAKKLAAVSSLLSAQMNPEPRAAVARRPGFSSRKSTPALTPPPFGSNLGAMCASRPAFIFSTNDSAEPRGGREFAVVCLRQHQGSGVPLAGEAAGR
jgi:hypothetical protein